MKIFSFELLLRDDPRAVEAVATLRATHGLSDENASVLLRHLAVVPSMWESLEAESPKARQVRRHKLANKLRRLALELADDPDFRRVRVLDHESVTETVPTRPLLSDFLQDLGQTLQTWHNEKDFWNGPLAYRQTTRNDRRSFVKREVTFALSGLIETAPTRPIAPAAKLASAVLQTDPDDDVTAGEMKDAFRYWAAVWGGD